MPMMVSTDYFSPPSQQSSLRQTSDDGVETNRLLFTDGNQQGGFVHDRMGREPCMG